MLSLSSDKTSQSLTLPGCVLFRRLQPADSRGSISPDRSRLACDPRSALHVLRGLSRTCPHSWPARGGEDGNRNTGSSFFSLESVALGSTAPLCRLRGWPVFTWECSQRHSALVEYQPFGHLLLTPAPLELTRSGYSEGVRTQS